jgi:hypothetical protein
LLFGEGNSGFEIFLLLDLDGFLNRVVGLFTGFLLDVLALNGLFDLFVIFEEFVVALQILVVVGL